MCPNGCSAEDAGNMSLFLYVTITEDTKFNVRYQFGFMNRNDQKIKYFRNPNKYNSSELKSGFGSQEFLSHDELFDASKNYVVDGKITIACKVS